MYLLVSICVAITSYYLFKKTGVDMNLRGLNMLSWVYYMQFITCCLVGATCAVYNVDNHYVITTVVQNAEQIRFYGWVLVLYTMIIFPISVILVKKIFLPCLKKRSCIIHSASITEKYPVIYILTFLAVISCIYVFYVSKYVGLINMVCGQVNLQEGISFSRNFAGNVYIRNIFAQMLSSLLSMVWYIELKLTHTRRARFFFILTLVFAILMVTQNYSKAPIIMLFISFIMLRIQLFGRLSRKHFLIGLATSIAGIIIMYINITDMSLPQIFSSYKTGILGRIFFSQISPLFKTLEYFPTVHGFIGFSSISRLLTTLIGSVYVDRSARIVMMLFNPEGVEIGVAGVMNTLFVAEAWANWGYIGALISPWITGIITGIIYYTTTKAKNLIYRVIYAYLSVRIPITGGFNDFIYPIWVILPCLLVMLMILKFDYRVKQ